MNTRSEWATYIGNKPAWYRAGYYETLRIDPKSGRRHLRKPSAQQRREAAGVTRHVIALQGADMLDWRARNAWRAEDARSPAKMMMRRAELRLRPFRRDS